MINKIIAFSIKNKALIGLMTIGLIIGGIWSMTKVPLDAVPDITNNQVQVITTAPNLGTFYRAPSPKAPPYVEVGDTVSEDTEICLVEVMKLFTTIQAGLSGTVREIVATDGKMVEFGEALMWIEPGA